MAPFEKLYTKYSLLKPTPRVTTQRPQTMPSVADVRSSDASDDNSSASVNSGDANQNNDKAATTESPSQSQATSKDSASNNVDKTGDSKSTAALLEGGNANGLSAGQAMAGGGGGGGATGWSGGAGGGGGAMGGAGGGGAMGGGAGGTGGEFRFISLVFRYSRADCILLLHPRFSKRKLLGICLDSEQLTFSQHVNKYGQMLVISSMHCPASLPT